MSPQYLFVIQCNEGIYGFYANLDKAKTEMKYIFDKTPDFKDYGYTIIVYELINNEYVITKLNYTYKFDIFLTEK
jgi:hypothetical protein